MTEINTKCLCNVNNQEFLNWMNGTWKKVNPLKNIYIYLWPDLHEPCSCHGNVKNYGHIIGISKFLRVMNESAHQLPPPPSIVQIRIKWVMADCSAANTCWNIIRKFGMLSLVLNIGLTILFSFEFRCCFLLEQKWRFIEMALDLTSYFKLFEPKVLMTKLGYACTMAPRPT